MNRLKVRKGIRVLKGRPTVDGAGVRLKRILGTPELRELDPFLLLDEMKSDRPEEYRGGFPNHPHRGFETVTYLLEGKFRHRDSKGNTGLLTAGAVQWMTAGRGVVHSEMPEMQDGRLWGYQLWLNLPAHLKMVEPRYQDILPEQIPMVAREGVRVKVISGTYQGKSGPVEPSFPAFYFDVTLPPNATWRHLVPPEMNTFVYLLQGEAMFGLPEDNSVGKEGEMVMLGEGEEVCVVTQGEAVRFLFFAGMRLNEPIVRAGPFVMNTQQEIEQAFLDYQQGSLGTEALKLP